MRLLLLLTCSALSLTAISQKPGETVITGDAAKQIMEQINIDTTAFLREASVNACKCIDSVDRAQSDRTKKMEGFSECIDKETGTYQLVAKLWKSMKSAGKENNIELAVDKNSNEYQRYYYEIERWLKDSCKVLNNAIATYDETNHKSLSKNPEAMAAYSKGLETFKNEDYAASIPWYEKAVKIDPEFVFAWDNLGISYRRTGKLDKAEAAYKSSLKAIKCYNEMQKYYPDDAEVYYGLALVYINNKKDWETGLDNMCKAYNIYAKEKSAYRSDAEKVINSIYTQMKKDNKEEVFNRILKQNNISPN